MTFYVVKFQKKYTFLVCLLLITVTNSTNKFLNKSTEKKVSQK